MSNIRLKILIIGDSDVGKTELVLKYCNEKPNEHITTIGVEYKNKCIDLNGRKVNLQIWDTSGQERFHSLTKNFCRTADGIIFIFDVTKSQTFQNIKHWISDITNEDFNLKKILVGNNIELVNRREIDIETMDIFAKKYNMKVFEISVKEEYNIDTSFTELASLILAGKSEEETNELYTIKPHYLSLNNLKRKRRKNNC